MINIFDFKKNKYWILILGIIIIFPYFLFFKCKREKIDSPEEKGKEISECLISPIVDLDHKLILLPDQGFFFNGEYSAYYDTSKWSSFIDELNLFRLKYPSASVFEVNQIDIDEYASDQYSEKGSELYAYYNIGLNMPFRDDLGGPYGLSFDILVFNLNKELTAVDNLSNIISIRESLWANGQGKKQAPFVSCESLSVKNSDDLKWKICSYCPEHVCSKEFYLFSKDKIYVMRNFIRHDTADYFEWSKNDAEGIMKATNSMQQKWMFEAIVSTFKALD